MKRKESKKKIKNENKPELETKVETEAETEKDLNSKMEASSEEVVEVEKEKPKKKTWTINQVTIWRILAYFAIYSFLGFVIETTYGLLTKGQLEVICLMDGKLKEYHTLGELSSSPIYQNLVKDSLYYNNASSYDEQKKEIIGGNITDRALLKFVVGSFPQYKKIIHIKKLLLIAYKQKHVKAVFETT